MDDPRDQRPSRVRISRRAFLGGSAAVVTAGGAAALVMRERDAGGAASSTVNLSPLVPTPPADVFADNETKLRHLLRRTTFAATPADVQRYAGTPLGGVVDDLLASTSADDSSADRAVAAAGYDPTKPADVVATWLARMIYTNRPMLERMTLFWHGLLTSGLTKTGPKRAGVMLTQNQFFRDHAFGRFDVLLKGVVRDPAMMLWLDIHTSRVGHPNENYPRELMELFTLGAGNYSEDDVRESARAHTGYSLDPSGAFIFRPKQHDNGQKTFLGQTGNFDADAIADIILAQEAAPIHFARRVFESFAYPDAEDAVIAPIAAVARTSGFDAKQVVRAVLTSEAFYAPKAYRAIVKSPTEYLVGSLRLLGYQPSARVVAAQSRSMGQVLFDPPNVAGWPGGRTWLGTSTWFARVNAAAAILNGGGATPPPAKGTKQPNFGKGQLPAAGIEAIFPSPPASADAAIDVAARATVDGRISDDARTTLRGYLDDGAAFNSQPATTRDQRLRGLLALLVASPEYQLA